MLSSTAPSSFHRSIATIIALLLCAAPNFAQKDKAKEKPVPDTPSNKPGAITHMDYGPAIAYTIKSAKDKHNIAYKGLAVGLGEKKNGEYQAALVYDLDTMRVLAGNVGGHLDISKINYSSYKGNDIAIVAGTQLISTNPGPGWTNPKTGKWDDPRTYKNGPLPKDWVDYRGHQASRDQVTLRYRINDCDILETPSIETIDNYAFITRTFEIGKSASGLTIHLVELDKTFNMRTPTRVGNNRLYVSEAAGLAGKLSLDSDKPRVFCLASTTNGKDHQPKFTIDGRRFTVTIPAAATPIRLKLMHWFGSQDAADGEGLHVMDGIDKALRKVKPPSPIEVLTNVESNTLSKRVTTQGTLGKPTNKTAYVVDTLPVPLDNPHNSWMRLTGFDFFADGKRAAVCTWNGDVWIVSGIDHDLKEVTWHRFASGLFEPLGIAIVDDEVYALGRDRLTKLHDKNKDGVADFYENFNADFPTYPRAITTELQVDSKGNFYFQKNGNRTPGSVPMHGSILRVNKDGSKADIFAHGIRSANGMGVGYLGKTEVIASSDQEGNWTPASRIDFLTNGQYVGYKQHAHTKGDPPDGAYKRPVCWLPKDVDNSPGGLAYIADDRWGPYKGNWIATSYGQCKLFLLMHQTEQWTQPKDYDPRNAGDTITQGGVVTFPLNFGTGIHRARFNKRDGQLYVLGLKGWQTKGAIDGGFYRVRYTGKPALLPAKLEAIDKGVRLTFATKLDRELAVDLESYEVKRWNYQYTSKYGSPEFSVANPEKKGRDVVTVRKAELSKDGKTVTLLIDDMKPVMQMMVNYDLETEDGSVMRNAVYHTVHVLGGK